MQAIGGRGQTGEKIRKFTAAAGVEFVEEHGDGPEYDCEWATRKPAPPHTISWAAKQRLLADYPVSR